MRATDQRWGNSLAVRIPKAIAEGAGIKEQDEREIERVGRIIQIHPCTPTPTLEALLAGLTAENLHADTDFGPHQGGEAW